jgi:hypothetical protein
MKRSEMQHGAHYPERWFIRRGVMTESHHSRKAQRDPG